MNLSLLRDYPKKRDQKRRLVDAFLQTLVVLATKT